MPTYCICPGIHDQKLTDDFIQNLLNFPINAENLLIFPADQYPPYSGFHVLQYIEKNCSKYSQELVIISFSAGVVGAISAAWGWQLQGKIIKGFIAFDGWGVPLTGNFPIYRVSHDKFTHWSSAVLGTGKTSFYADPAVDHLDLWRSPQTVNGWMVDTTTEDKKCVVAMSLIEFLRLILVRL